MRKNTDSVVYDPQDESSWTFYVRGKAKMLSEVIDEISEIAEKIFNITKGFFLPTKIEYSLTTESENFHANGLFGTRIEPLDRFPRKIESDKGISYNKLKEDIQSIIIPKDLVLYIRRIKMDGKTKFFLKGGDKYIDCNSKGLYVAWTYNDEVSDEQPGLNPLSITIAHDSLKGHSEHVEINDPAYYKIVFWTYTNMWFENTDIGLVNRNRLRNVLREMYDNFDVVFTLFLSDRFSEERLEDIVFGQD